MFLILEKFVFKKYLKKGIFSHLYTFVIILFSFVIFSVTDLKELFVFIKGMLGIGVPLVNFESVYYLKNILIIFIISFVLMGPFVKNIIIKLEKGRIGKLVSGIEILCILLILVISISVIISSSFNPFIYFRF